MTRCTPSLMSSTDIVEVKQKRWLWLIWSPLALPALAVGLYAPSFLLAWVVWIVIILLVAVMIILRRIRPWLVYLCGGLVLGTLIWWALALWNALHHVETVSG